MELAKKVNEERVQEERRRAAAEAAAELEKRHRRARVHCPNAAMQQCFHPTRLDELPYQGDQGARIGRPPQSGRREKEAMIKEMEETVLLVDKQTTSRKSAERELEAQVGSDNQLAVNLQSIRVPSASLRRRLAVTPTQRPTQRLT